MRHTRKEREAIARGYSAMEYLCGGFDTKAEWMLRDALRHERRERSTIHDAKALLCESFMEGWDSDDMEGNCAETLAGAYALAAGCRSAYLIGAAFRRRTGEKCGKWAVWLADIRGAKPAHDAATARALEELRVS